MRVLLALLLTTILSALITGQTCEPPAVSAGGRSSSNMFDPEQEGILGDLVVQDITAQIKRVRDPQMAAYLERIGVSLVKHLPATGIKYHFYLVDLPEANAFSIPGGHIFISRKLVAFVNSEDELAAVLAHELGHSTMHHSASDLSAQMRKILNVTAVSDRKDITEKYNLLIENFRTKHVSRAPDHESGEQLEADRIGLYALVAAGYDPNAFYTMFDRLADTRGKTGSWFGDLFGTTTPDQKRLREVSRATETLPTACRDGRTAKQNDDFQKWQAAVVSYRPAAPVEQLPGLVWKKAITPQLRSDIDRIKVSSDGRYLVTRDDFALTVLEREPLRVLFQIPAEGVADFYVTPNDEDVVFDTARLRYERWNIAAGKAVEVRELVFPHNCMDDRLSPDGRYLACVDNSARLTVVELSSGKRIFEKNDFYKFNYYEYLSSLFAASLGVKSHFFRIEFTPDSGAVIFSRSNLARGSFYRGASDVSYNDSYALDLSTLKRIGLGGDIDNVFSRAYVFLTPATILGMGSREAEDGGVFSFPDGKRLQKFTFYAREIRSTGNPNYFIIKPLKDSKMGIFDAKTAQLAAGLNKEDATIWKNTVIFESVSGRITIREMSGTGKATLISQEDKASIDIPVAAIGDLTAAEVSDNFDWMAISTKTRGGLWQLSSGERRVYSPGFRGGLVADDGGAISEFPSFNHEDHSLVLLNPTNSQLGVITPLPTSGAKQYGRFLMLRSSLAPKQDNVKPNDKEPSDTDPVYDEHPLELLENVRFELKDFVQSKVIWSRDFVKEAPGYSFDSYSGRLMLYWRLDSDTGKSRLKEYPNLKAKADALGNKDSDYLIEVIDAFTSQPVSQLLVETGKGSFNVGQGLSEGKWLVLYDSAGRVLVYSLETGELKHRFFGNRAALSPLRDQVAVENFPGEISIFDMRTGDLKNSVVISGSAAFLRFNLQGNRLFVFSDLQVAYNFDVSKPTPAP